MAVALTASAGSPQLVKLCSSMIEAGKAYVATSRLFVSGVRDLSQQCQGDAVISVRAGLSLTSGGRAEGLRGGMGSAGLLASPQECLQRFGDSLQEMANHHVVSARADGSSRGRAGGGLGPQHEQGCPLEVASVLELTEID